MPLLFINDIQMHYVHSKPDQPSPDQYPLLMLSGMASDNASWQPIITPLQAHYELLIPDNRCTGRTQPNPVETSRDHMVNDVLMLLDALSIERVNVLGHSMGAMIGWALAAKAPDRVNHLVSACAISHVIPARLSLFNALAALRSDQNEAQWFELLYQFLFSPAFFEQPTTVSQAVAASISYSHKQGYRSFKAQATALNTFLAPVNLNTIQCPVSLVTGANDVLMTPSLLQAFCDENNYPFAVIPDAAHALHWEQSEAFVQYVLAELTGVNAPKQR